MTGEELELGVPKELTEQVELNTESVGLLNKPEFVEGSVDNKIKTATDPMKDDIESLKEVTKNLAGGISMKRVESLPTQFIKTNVIYLKTTSTPGKYDQYIWDQTLETWFAMGSTEIDFEGLTKQEYMTQTGYDDLVKAGQIDPDVDYNTWEE